MDPITISLIITTCGLIVERLFSWLGKIKKSKCCGGAEMELNQSQDKENK